MKGNLAKLLKKHTSGWVSISHDNKKVIASDKTLEGLVAKLARMSNPDGYLMKAAKDYSRYMGYGSKSIGFTD